MSVEQVAASQGQRWADENGALIIDVREPVYDETRTARADFFTVSD